MELTVVDAGVLIALGSPDDAHHRSARAFFEESRLSRRLLLPASALAEALVGPMRSHGEGGGRARVERVLAMLHIAVVPLDAATARRAAALRSRHGTRLRLPDALVVATAVEHQAGVVTTDRRWPDVGVRVRVLGAEPS